MNLAGELARLVRERAGDRCQYCLMRQSLQGATFHIEHVIPRCKGGSSEMTNLAFACPSCNLHKTDRTAATDPVTGSLVQLFHPVEQIWTEHFRVVGREIHGLTSTGRATVAALDFNHSRRQQIRAAEERLGL